MKIYIKNMVCQRCILAVQKAAENCGLQIKSITLGEIELNELSVDDEKINCFEKVIHSIGFERIDDKRSRIIEKIKAFVIEKIHHSDREQNLNWSKLIARLVNYEYNYISNLFSSTEGITIEQFIIRQKIEKVKELLFYNELTLAEIAYRLGYSSPAYLTNQFKKITGMTPGQFRKLHYKNRNPIDQL